MLVFCIYALWMSSALVWPTNQIKAKRWRSNKFTPFLTHPSIDWTKHIDRLVHKLALSCTWIHVGKFAVEGTAKMSELWILILGHKYMHLLRKTKINLYIIQTHRNVTFWLWMESFFEHTFTYFFLIDYLIAGINPRFDGSTYSETALFPHYPLRTAIIVNFVSEWILNELQLFFFVLRGSGSLRTVNELELLYFVISLPVSS